MRLEELKEAIKCSKSGRLPNRPSIVKSAVECLFRDEFRFNEFTSNIELVNTKSWPRESDSSVLTETDIITIRNLFDAHYITNVSKNYVADAIRVVALKNKYHPIRDYFDKLEWDGVNRLDALLIDCLGAEDTQYVRAVTRKTLVAAVARVFNPGIKFDSMLVLCGGQGIGKSTIFRRLGSIGGKNYTADSLTMREMSGKDGAEKLRNVLIMEISELSGMNRTDVETIKSFLSRNEDHYRVPFDRTVSVFNRQCIIVGTTNALNGFLRDPTGNRRFWPVNCNGGSKTRSWELTDEYIDQVWAEAKHYYDEGEKLYLEGEYVELASDAQREAMESDERFGLVEDFLERKLADNWYSLSIAEHKDFLYRQQAVCTIPREYVCNLEIYREALNGNLDRLDRKESYTIRNIMAKMPGWEFCGAAKKRFGVYGNQQYYRRVSVTPADSDSDKESGSDSVDLSNLKKSCPTPPPLTSFDEDYRNGLFETVINAEIPEGDSFNDIGDDLTI